MQHTNTLQGPHLDDLTPKEATNCSHDVTMEALNFKFGKESNCSTTQTCENVRFTTKYTTEETWLENKSSVYVMLENPEVQYHHSYISYDLVSNWRDRRNSWNNPRCVSFDTG